MSGADGQKETEHRLTTLESNARQTTERLDAHEKAFEKINDKIEDIIQLLSARPTWLVTVLITTLTTITASLIVYVVTLHH